MSAHINTFQMNSRPIWTFEDMYWKKDVNGSVYTYRITTLFNSKSKSFYINDEITLIGKKCFALLLARPIQASIKTIYHLCLPISIPREIYLAVKKELEKQHGKQKNIQQLIKAGMVAFMKNFADIVRTPLYGIVLTLFLFVGITLVIMHSKKIYDFRVIAGKIELSLLWGDKYSSWILAPCFQELTNLEDIENDWGQRIHSDTNYSRLNPLERAKANLARAIIIQFTRNKKRHSKCSLQKTVSKLFCIR